MKKFKIASVVIASLMVAGNAMAQGTSNSEITGYVVSIPFQDPSRTAVFVRPAGSISNNPSCNTTSRFVFDSNTTFGKQALATIMVAQVNGEVLRLAGTGSCPSSTLSSNSEELRKICTASGPC